MTELWDKVKAWAKRVRWWNELVIFVFIILSAAFVRDVSGVVFFGGACAFTRWLIGKFGS